MKPEEKKQVLKARKNFAAIAASYFMGLFNDNFYKEAAVILAVSQGKTKLQAFAMGLFTICYIMFTAQSGWFADKYPKRNVIIAAKLVELIAMIAGAIGIWYMYWPLVLLMIGIMGAQSALFSPAMNGAIPELYPEWYVPKANAIVKVISTIGIFTGMIVAGPVLDRAGTIMNIPASRFIVGLLVLIAGIIGLLTAFGAPKRKAGGTHEKFPLFGPINSIFEYLKTRKDPLLFMAINTNVVIWFIASLMTMLIVNLATGQLGLSSTVTVIMKVMFMAGISVGGFISNIITKKYSWEKVVVKAVTGVGVSLSLFFFFSYFPESIRLYTMYALIIIAGVSGGICLIPITSFIQIRPAADRKGQVIAASNFAIFIFMTFGAFCLYILNDELKLLPTNSIGTLGIFSIIASFFLMLGYKKIKEN